MKNKLFFLLVIGTTASLNAASAQFGRRLGSQLLSFGARPAAVAVATQLYREQKKTPVLSLWKGAIAGLALVGSQLSVVECEQKESLEQKCKRFLKEGRWTRISNDPNFRIVLQTDGGDINKEDLNGQTYLIKACIYGEVEAVDILLQKDALIDPVDIHKHNAFHLTTICFCENTAEILKLLLSTLHKKQKEPLAVLNQAGADGRTALMCLCKASIPVGSESVFDESLDLLIRESDPLCEDAYARNAAFYLLMNRSPSMNEELKSRIKKLQAAGYDLQAKDHNGHNLIDYVILYEPAREKALAKIKILLAVGVKPTFRYLIFLHGLSFLKTLRKVLL